MSNIEINATAKELLSIRSMIAELEAEAEALTDKIKSAMTERGEEVLTGDGWRASWKNVSRSSGRRCAICTATVASRAR